MVLKRLIATTLMLNALSANALTLVEYRDSNDWRSKVQRTLNDGEKFTINLEKTGWSKCEFRAVSAPPMIQANCFTEEQKVVSYSCYGDEEIEIMLSGNSKDKISTSIKLVCNYKK
jgi:hypothetical protein